MRARTKCKMKHEFSRYSSFVKKLVTNKQIDKTNKLLTLPHLRQLIAYSPLTGLHVELLPPHTTQRSYLTPDSSLLSQPTDWKCKERTMGKDIYLADTIYNLKVACICFDVNQSPRSCFSRRWLGADTDGGQLQGRAARTKL